jgi:hypothetical protein
MTHKLMLTAGTGADATATMLVPHIMQYDSYAFEGKRWKLVGSWPSCSSRSCMNGIGRIKFPAFSGSASVGVGCQMLKSTRFGLDHTLIANDWYRAPTLLLTHDKPQIRHHYVKIDTWLEGVCAPEHPELWQKYRKESARGEEAQEVDRRANGGGSSMNASRRLAWNASRYSVFEAGRGGEEESGEEAGDD